MHDVNLVYLNVEMNAMMGLWNICKSTSSTYVSWPWEFIINYNTEMNCCTLRWVARLHSTYTVFVYSVHYTVYSVHCTVYISRTWYCMAAMALIYAIPRTIGILGLYCILYTIYYTLYTIHYTLYSVQCTLYTIAALSGPHRVHGLLCTRCTILRTDSYLLGSMVRVFKDVKVGISFLTISHPGSHSPIPNPIPNPYTVHYPKYRPLSKPDHILWIVKAPLISLDCVRLNSDAWTLIGRVPG